MRGTSLTRRVRFFATHRYHRPEWDDAKNLAVFGACAAPEPHAHEYVCDVTVAGAIDSKTGMVVDLALFDRVLDAEVVNALDGKSLNEALPECASGGKIPTCEEVAGLIAVRVGHALAAANATAMVRAVCLAEDETLSATWTPDT